jgi:hypothetical protein
MGQTQAPENNETTMNTRTDSELSLKAPSHPELKQQKWNLYIGEEPYGFVHAGTEREALDRVAAFKRPFRAELAADQD